MRLNAHGINLPDRAALARAHEVPTAIASLVLVAAAELKDEAARGGVVHLEPPSLLLREDAKVVAHFLLAGVERKSDRGRVVDFRRTGLQSVQRCRGQHRAALDVVGTRAIESLLARTLPPAV